MRLQKILNPAFAENFSCLSHCEVTNLHPYSYTSWAQVEQALLCTKILIFEKKIKTPSKNEILGKYKYK